MNTVYRLPILLILLAGCSKGPPVPPPSGAGVAEGDDLKLFAGKWAIVKFDLGGDETPPMEEFESTVIEINGSLVSTKDGDRRPGEYATIKLGAVGSKEIDLTEADKDGIPREREVYTSSTWSTGTTPPARTKKPAETVKGLYKFDGNTLTVAFTAPSQPRPTDFVAVAKDKTKRDSGVFVLTFRKIDDAEAFKRVTTPRRPAPTTAFIRPKPTNKD